MSAHESLGQQFNTPESAEGQCEGASRDYVQHLHERGIPARTVEYQYPKSRLTPGSPMDREMKWNHDDQRYDDPIHHTVVEAGSRTIDWTARQHTPDAPHPLIEPTKKARARWQSHEVAS